MSEAEWKGEAGSYILRVTTHSPAGVLIPIPPQPYAATSAIQPPPKNHNLTLFLHPDLRKTAGPPLSPLATDGAESQSEAAPTNRRERVFAIESRAMWRFLKGRVLE